MARSKPTKQKLPHPRESSDGDDPPRKISVFDDPPRKNVLLLSCMDQRLLDDTVWFMNCLNLHNRYDQVALAGGAMGTLQLPDPKLPVAERWQGVFEVHLEKAINVLHRPIKDVFLLDHLDCGAYKHLHPNEQIQEKYRKADRDGMIALHRSELKKLAAEVRRYIDDQRQKAENEFHAAREACNDCNEEEQHEQEQQATQEGEKSCWDYVGDLAEEKSEAWSGIRVSYFVMDLLGVVTQLDVPKGQRATLEC